MPTPPKGPRLGGSPAHERLILRNLAQSLFEHGKITTTLAKAKRLRPFAEKLITTAKRSTLHSRRQVLKSLTDKDVVHKLFEEIGPSFATRDGGYTRITKTMPRKGDNAPMAVIELITEETVSSAASRVARASASKKKAAEATAQPAEIVAEAIEAEDAEIAAETVADGAVEETAEVASEAAEDSDGAAEEPAAEESPAEDESDDK